MLSRPNRVRCFKNFYIRPGSVLDSDTVVPWYIRLKLSVVPRSDAGTFLQFSSASTHSSYIALDQVVYRSTQHENVDSDAP